ncbi:MAG: zf-HC2 domain-containing protein, partial [Neisseria sp.]|nr:zf-HC2 domain-containing protein [Neisseria sp.]
MLKCKEACSLLSQSQDRPLTFRERITLRLHLLFCVHCRRYRKQLDVIRESVR